MGYEVSGGGEFILRTDELGAKVKVPDDVLALLTSAEFLVEDSPDGEIWLTFEYGPFNDQIEDALNAFAYYVKKGGVEFRDDFGDHFRYRLADGNVWYADGEVVFPRERKISKPLQLYRQTITETKTYEYTIRATNRDEAVRMFAEWYNNHMNVVDRDLANTDGERQFGTPTESWGNPDYADIVDCQQKEEVE